MHKPTAWDYYLGTSYTCLIYGSCVAATGLLCYDSLNHNLKTTKRFWHKMASHKLGDTFVVSTARKLRGPILLSGRDVSSWVKRQVVKIKMLHQVPQVQTTVISCMNL